MASEIIRMSRITAVGQKAGYDGRIYHPSKREAWSADWIAGYKVARKRSVDRRNASLDRIRRESLFEVPIDMSIDISRVMTTMRHPPLRQDHMMRFFALFIRDTFVGYQNWRLEKALSSNDRSTQQGFLLELMRNHVSIVRSKHIQMEKILSRVSANDIALFWKETGFTGANRLGVKLV